MMDNSTRGRRFRVLVVGIFVCLYCLSTHAKLTEYGGLNPFSINLTAPILRSPARFVEDSTDGGEYYAIDLWIVEPEQKIEVLIDSSSSRSFILDSRSCPSFAQGGCLNISAYGDDWEWCTYCQIKHDQYCRQALVNITLDQAEDFRADRWLTCIAKYISPYLKYSILGIAPSEGSSEVHSIFNTFPRESVRAIGMNLNGPGEFSEFHFGGWDVPRYNSSLSSGFQPQLLWSETQQASASAHWEFPLFHFRYCGAELFSPATNYMAKISTGQTCLGLPTHFFDRMKLWLSEFILECGQPRGLISQTESGPICYIKQNVSIENLPILTFRLSSDGPDLYVPLSMLVAEPYIGDDSNLRSFCIRDTESSTYDPRIILGTRILRRMYAVILGDEKRVGLANKYPPSTNNTHLHCPANIPCDKHESFNDQTGKCEKIRCYRYFGHQIDPKTNQCVLSPVFKVLLLLALASVFVMESILAVRYYSVSKAVIGEEGN